MVNKLAIVDVPKIVDKYILRTFIPLFVMSFAVCWFIVVMQFLWRYIDELVGKGLSGFMLLKIIFYAALSFIPMSLPLGILLASLMTLAIWVSALSSLRSKPRGSASTASSAPSCSSSWRWHAGSSTSKTI